jgi:hypothetical protein
VKGRWKPERMRVEGDLDEQLRLFVDLMRNPTVEDDNLIEEVHVSRRGHICTYDENVKGK